jgi:hypothetical protein
LAIFQFKNNMILTNILWSFQFGIKSPIFLWETNELQKLQNPNHFKNIKEPFSFHEGINNGLAIFNGQLFVFLERKTWLHTKTRSLICYIPMMGMHPRIVMVTTKDLLFLLIFNNHPTGISTCTKVFFSKSRNFYDKFQ